MEIDYLNFFREDTSIAIELIFVIFISSLFNINICILLFMIFLMLIWFFRKPIINKPYYSMQFSEVYAPAYGTIEKIEHINGRYKISIQLSLLDIHTQYYPVSGEVINQEYAPMHVATTIRNLIFGARDRIVTVTQRIGYIARRIVTPKICEHVHTGQYLGMIKFGSHVDIELPDGYKLLVKPGDRLCGPYTLIAIWNGQ